jgi:hypothetical protein
MKSLFGMLAAGIVAAAFGSVALAHDTGSASHMTTGGQKVTITGNVVDLSCYMSPGEHGASHAACAKACLLKGQPFGIQTSDGNIVTILGNGPGASYADKLAPYVEQKVTVSGTEFTSHGVTGIQIDTIAAAK